MHNKFILEEVENKGICIFLGNVQYHKELCINESNVIGGGMFIKKQDKIIFLSGSWMKSKDFGIAKLEDIKNAVENNNVYYYPFKSVNMKFACKDGSGLEEIDLN
jgi:hypothetical protein